VATVKPAALAAVAIFWTISLAGRLEVNRV
jgi:hypothetical protein